MPVLDIGGARHVESGSVVLRTGVRTAKIAISAATVTVDFSPGAPPSGAWGKGPNGADDFVLHLPQPANEQEPSYWAGSIEDGGTVYIIAIMGRRAQIDVDAIAFDYTITI
ncbi:hypothetical protein [Brevundimonas vesicularis]|uniref:Uncharacterized protein n=1 Tax=Brevundimonas vesicularis TaxID=41276 RepID=A0A1Z3U7Z5_BREVE|nr:hypothetical protein [Brevundimonas vesicularis]ASE39352.1 hypothetical protein CEP68_07465 [Brevundimonas vesicularis]